eukprot:CAMPEP_0181168274 /NCGR_PEP_ID=MMETSP1096-20121128/181_1 /TAXON_ID=156174 ORGANISM="Chrysochromulina ericina, Strain CCMP281" /NCGR_SAMPLE_ID=MMETSP1096 /ASSEMBLY_ACC=CAM_ASM_000453 /LENGTH=35 /DNA_ID= /DNA_START= /DNA_END= /DNA_ORIENTATION=
MASAVKAGCSRCGLRSEPDPEHRAEWDPTDRDRAE